MHDEMSTDYIAKEDVLRCCLHLSYSIGEIAFTLGFVETASFICFSLKLNFSVNTSLSDIYSEK